MISAITNFAQSKTIPGSYTIINNKHPENETFYRKSVDGADMEQFRLRDKRVLLSFDNGFELELQSAKELFLKNQQVNVNNYEVSRGSNTEPPVFNILPSGQLTARVSSKLKQ